MRHVPITEFKDKMAEVMLAAEGGEEVIITRHGRDYMRLMPMRVDDIESRKRAFAELAVMREQMRQRGVPTTTRAEILEWIAEGRR